MQIRKAVITAAGRGVRLYPAAETVQKAMLPMVDRDGLTKPVIQIIAEEALDSGIEEIVIVSAPEDESKYRRQFGALQNNLINAHDGASWAEEEARRIGRLLDCIRFAIQEEPLGYGHAVHCAWPLIEDEPFLLLLSDHLYVSHLPGVRCARQLLDTAEREACAVAAVQSTREHLISRYGTLGCTPVADQPGVYRIDSILEKPSISRAEIELQTPGLRAGHYLCFFGMHALSPAVFEILDALSTGGEREFGLTPALQELARREKYLALEVRGARYDIGAQYGLVQAQLALAMDGQDRDRVLSTLVEVLAESVRRREVGS